LPPAGGVVAGGESGAGLTGFTGVTGDGDGDIGVGLIGDGDVAAGTIGDAIVLSGPVVLRIGRPKLCG
jgi:hypothetical protein